MSSSGAEQLASAQGHSEAAAIDTSFDLPKSPYPGLRPFEVAEWPIFFGRERMTDEVIARLIKQRLLVVHGDSGCGKSSLIYAGVLPRLEQESARSQIRWRTYAATPGDDPLWRLASQLAKLRPAAERQAATLELRRMLNHGAKGAERVAEFLRPQPDDHVCIVVDQFEELFAHAKQHGAQDASLLVDFLIGIREQRPRGLYAVLTMRSEFLGACAQFRHFAEVVNDAQYLVPRMEYADLFQAIREPATLYGGEIDHDLAERLIADASGSKDPLPLIQHGLLSLYREHVLGEHSEPPQGWHLGLEHYAGDNQSLAERLSTHADKVARSVEARFPDHGVAKLVERLFRALTDVNADGQALRRPQKLKDLIAVTAGDEPVVRAIVDAFRADGVSLLRPYGDSPLSLDDSIDVSHEALIRCWSKIADPKEGWLMKEFKAGLVWRSLLVQVVGFEENSTNLLSAAAAEERAAWLKEFNPSWSKRYGGEWARVETLVQASINERNRRAAHALAERARARRIAFVSVAVAAALVLSTVIYYFSYVKATSRSFASVGAVNGTVKGVGRALTEQQLRHRRVSYRVVTKGRFGEVLRVEAVNAKSELTRVGPDYFGSERGRWQYTSTWKYAYDADGRLASELQYTNDGHLVQGKIYVPALDPNARLAYFMGNNGMPTSVRGRTETSAYYWAEKLQYASETATETISYLGPFGEPVPGAFQAFRTRSTHDLRGNLIEETSLDISGNAMNDAAGNATLKLEYDAAGNAVKTTAFDAQRKITTVREGWAIRRNAYDNFGNVLEEAYYDANDKPATSKKGWHKAAYAFNDDGTLQLTRYFDIANKPTADAELGCYGRRERYDAKNQLVLATCVDERVKPRKNRFGYVSTSYSYDKAGQTLSATSLDEAGNNTLGEHSYALASYAYDDGRLREVSYRDELGKPTLSDEGYFRRVLTYADGGRLETSSYFGVDETPILIPDGYASVLRKRDTSWNVVESRYFGRFGEAVMAQGGYAGVRTTFDARGQQTETYYLGRDGEVVFSRNGYAGWKSEFDDLGRETATRYRGPAGQPIAKVPEGHAGWKSEFDPWNREIRRSYFGPDGAAVRVSTGEAGWRASYDAKDNQTELTYVDKDGHPTLHAWGDQSRFTGTGFATLKKAFDPRGNVTEEAYFGVDGKAILAPEGWSIVKTTFDERGRAVRAEYLGTSREPVPLKSGGYHAVTRKYDARGNAEEIRYFDASGKPVLSKDGFAVLKKQYDRLGKITLQEVFGVQEEAVAMADGAHARKTLRDDQGKEKRFESLDVKGALLEAFESDYDPQGNLTEQRHKDAQGRLSATPENPCAVLRQKWSERGERTEVECLDAQGSPSPHLGNGATRTVYIYGRPGEIADERYFDEKGNPFTTAAGYAAIRYKYDSLGQQTEVAYLNAKGEQVDTKLGFAKLTTEYNAAGDPTEEAYLTAQDGPAQPVARITTEFDAQRRKATEKYFGPGGTKARISRDGQHVTVYHYDEYGNLKDLTYLDAQDRATRGYARGLETRWQLCGRWLPPRAADGQEPRPDSPGTCELALPSNP